MKVQKSLVLAFAVGMAIALPVGCGSSTGSGTCNTTNCTGCCNSKGTCVGGSANGECGTKGMTCSACSGSTPMCSAGVCKATGGGAGGGTGGAAGGGTGGATGGGTGGGAAGGGAGGGAAGGGAGGGAAGGGAGGGAAGGGAGGGAAGGGAGGGAAGGGAGGGTPTMCGAAALADHLLLSEIRTQPTNGETIEIYNPTAAAIDLSDYRIYNASFVSSDGLSDCHYYSHAALPDGGTCGAAFTDFDVQFPAGAMINAGQIKVIAVSGTYAFCDGGGCTTALPDFEITAGGANHPSVPDMRGTYDPGATNGFLTNAAEDVILYKWDGVMGNNVKDVDYFIYGNGIRTSKTGVGSYLADTATASQSVMDGGTSVTTSYNRGCYNETNETKTGGNGVTGHDETSEPHNTNWFVGPPSIGVKTPGSVP